MNAEPFLYLTPDRGAHPSTSGSMLCPLCGEQNIHLDDVYVSGRPREDGDIVPVHVDHHGRTDTHTTLPIMNTGRRHSIALGGWCEHCGGRFTIEFTQHKGDTLVAVHKQAWTPVIVHTPDDQLI